MSLIEFNFIDNHENIEIKTPGLIKIFAGDSIPAGYLECNGAEVLIDTYPDLYDAIGNSFCPPPYRESGEASVAVKSGGNTGDGALTMNEDSPLDNTTPAGTYTVRCSYIDASDMDKAEFELKDPENNLLATIKIDEGYWGLLRFTITNDTTAFAIGDGWDIEVTAGEIITPSCTEGYFRLPSLGKSSRVTSLSPFSETIIYRNIIKT